MEPIDYQKVFGSPGEHDDWVREYLRDLRQNWAAAEATVTKSVTAIIALATAFLLIAAHGIGEVAIAGVKITRLAPVEAAIPVMITYLFYVTAQNSATSFLLGIVHDELCQYYWPAFYLENLELTLRPVGSLTGVSLTASHVKNEFLANTLAMVGFLRFIVFVIGPFTFAVYAMVALWRQSEMPTVLAALSTGLSSVLLLAVLPSLVSIAAIASRKL